MIKILSFPETTINGRDELSQRKKMQNLEIEPTDSTTETREPATLHVDKKQRVMHESLYDLTGETSTSRTWLFINDKYVSIENNYQAGTKLMVKGMANYVTTESMAGLFLWQNYHDLLISKVKTRFMMINI